MKELMELKDIHFDPLKARATLNEKKGNPKKAIEAMVDSNIFYAKISDRNANTRSKSTNLPA